MRVKHGPVSRTQAASATAPVPRFADQSAESNAFSVVNAFCLDALGPLPNILPFSYVTGLAPPVPISVLLTSEPWRLTWTATATSTPAGWLSVDNPSGATPDQLRVRVNPAGLTTGAYRGVITVAAAGRNYQMPVTLTVTESRISDNAFFVRQLYLDIFGREPDADGLNFWLGELKSGKATRSQMASWFFSSAEFHDAGLFIIYAYIAGLGRDQDYGGWNFYAEALRLGLTRLDLAGRLTKRLSPSTAGGSIAARLLARS